MTKNSIWETLKKFPGYTRVSSNKLTILLICVTVGIFLDWGVNVLPIQVTHMVEKHRDTTYIRQAHTNDNTDIDSKTVEKYLSRISDHEQPDENDILKVVDKPAFPVSHRRFSPESVLERKVSKDGSPFKRIDQTVATVPKDYHLNSVEADNTIDSKHGQGHTDLFTDVGNIFNEHEGKINDNVIDKKLSKDDEHVFDLKSARRKKVFTGLNFRGQDSSGDVVDDFFYRTKSVDMNAVSGRRFRKKAVTYDIIDRLGKNDMKYSEMIDRHRAARKNYRQQTRKEKIRPVLTVKDGQLYYINSSITFVPKEDLDIMNTRPPTFLPGYKNPCFYGNMSGGLMNDNSFHCLPYFYIIGVKKSGTTDLYTRLSTHPYIITSSIKEPQWFSRVRFHSPETISQSRSSFRREIGRAGVDNKNISFYVHMFDRLAASIKLYKHAMRRNYSSQSSPTDDIVPHITVDATPANLHMNRWWEILPGNEGLDEPRFTNINYIHHLNPAAKIIILFRDPVTRLFSDYWHTSKYRAKKASVDKFHMDCSILTKTYSQCFMVHSLRACVYNNSIVKQLKQEGVVLAESFMASFYYIYMSDIYKTFDRENVMPILTTDYIHNMSNVLNQVLHFLDIRPMTTRQLQRAINLPVQNKSKQSRISRSMYNETRDMLYDFFAPFNKQMAQLMDDERYLFKRK